MMHQQNQMNSQTSPAGSSTHNFSTEFASPPQRILPPSGTMSSPMLMPSTPKRSKTHNLNEAPPNPLISETEKCRICSEPAAKHVHYGAVTCFSCRAFFRRSVFNGSSARYSCRRRNDCVISARTRRACQRCRYDQCLAAGMRPSWVLSEEEKKKRFRKTIKKKEQKKAKEAKGSKTASNVDKASAMPNSNRPQSAEDEIDDDEDAAFASSFSSSSSTTSEFSPRPPRKIFLDRIEQPFPFAAHHQANNAYHQALAPAPPPSYHHPIDMSRRSAMWSAPPIHVPSLPPPPTSTFASPNYSSTYHRSMLLAPPVLVARSFDTSNYDEPLALVKEREMVEPEPEIVMVKIVKRKKKALKFVDIRASSSVIWTEPRLLFCPDEASSIRSFSRSQHCNYTSVYLTEDLLTEIIMCSVFGMAISLKASENAQRFLLLRFVTMAKMFPTFATLPVETRKRLLQSNSGSEIILRAAMVVTQGNRSIQQSLAALGVDDVDLGRQIIRTAADATRVEERMDCDDDDHDDGESESFSREIRYRWLIAQIGEVLSANLDIVPILSSVILFSGGDDATSAIHRMLVNMLGRAFYAKLASLAEAAEALRHIMGCVEEISGIRRTRPLS